jgi:hypothetical protein
MKLVDGRAFSGKNGWRWLRIKEHGSTVGWADFIKPNIGDGIDANAGQTMKLFTYQDVAYYFSQDREHLTHVKHRFTPHSIIVNEGRWGQALTVA